MLLCSWVWDCLEMFRSKWLDQPASENRGIEYGLIEYSGRSLDASGDSQLGREAQALINLHCEGDELADVGLKAINTAIGQLHLPINESERTVPHAKLQPHRIRWIADALQFEVA